MNSASASSQTAITCFALPAYEHGDRQKRLRTKLSGRWRSDDDQCKILLVENLDI